MAVTTHYLRSEISARVRVLILNFTISLYVSAPLLTVLQEIVSARPGWVGWWQVYSALLLTNDQESDLPGVLISPAKVAPVLVRHFA